MTVSPVRIENRGCAVPRAKALEGERKIGTGRVVQKDKITGCASRPMAFRCRGVSEWRWRAAYAG